MRCEDSVDENKILENGVARTFRWIYLVGGCQSQAITDRMHCAEAQAERDKDRGRKTERSTCLDRRRYKDGKRGKKTEIRRARERDTERESTEGTETGKLKQIGQKQ